MRDAEFEQRLLRVARGLEKADLVLKGGNVFNSFTGEWETADVAVCGSVIAGIGSYKGTEEYNMAGKYLTPGFLDAHMHIESTMLAPRELARLLLLNGVTGNGHGNKRRCAGSRCFTAVFKPSACAWPG